jgi:KDO2-lipid IV(A) lauroyltransferase
MIDTLKTVFIASILRMMSWVPLRLLHKFADLMSRLAFALPTETRRITLINLKLAFPSLSETERRNLALQSIQETFKAAFELGHIWYGSIEYTLSLVKDVQGLDLVKAAQSSGRGIIFAAPHLGSWELLGVYISSLGPMTTLYKPPKIKGLDRLIAASRSKAGAELVPTNRQGVVSLTRALQKGGATGILPDQQPHNDGGVFAPLFGTQAFTMTLLPKLAAKTNAFVIFAYAKRRANGEGFEIAFIPGDPDICNPDPVLAATALNRSVEECVGAAPAQYQWAYKRFKKRPDDSPAQLY